MTLDSKRGCSSRYRLSFVRPLGRQSPSDRTFSRICVLALKADTGERSGIFRWCITTFGTYDIPAPPNLVTVEQGGRKIDAVTQVAKIGHLFVLDRETGKPLFPVEERPCRARNSRRAELADAAVSREPPDMLSSG